MAIIEQIQCLGTKVAQKLDSSHTTELGYLSDPPAPNCVIYQEHTGCCSRGALDGYHLASYGDLPRAMPDTLEGK